MNIVEQTQPILVVIAALLNITLAEGLNGYEKGRESYGGCQVSTSSEGTKRMHMLVCKGADDEPHGQYPFVSSFCGNEAGDLGNVLWTVLTTGKPGQHQLFSGRDIEVQYRFGENGFTYSDRWAWEDETITATYFDVGTNIRFLQGIASRRNLIFQIGFRQGVVEFDQEAGKVVNDFARRCVSLTSEFPLTDRREKKTPVADREEPESPVTMVSYGRCYVIRAEEGGKALTSIVCRGDSSDSSSEDSPRIILYCAERPKFEARTDFVYKWAFLDAGESQSNVYDPELVEYYSDSIVSGKDLTFQVREELATIEFDAGTDYAMEDFNRQCAPLVDEEWGLDETPDGRTIRPLFQPPQEWIIEETRKFHVPRWTQEYPEAMFNMISYGKCYVLGKVRSGEMFSESVLVCKNDTSERGSRNPSRLVLYCVASPSRLYRWVLIDTGENQSQFVYPHNVKHVFRTIEFEKHLEIEVDNEQVVIEFDEDASKAAQDFKERCASSAQD